MRVRKHFLLMLIIFFLGNIGDLSAQPITPLTALMGAGGACYPLTSAWGPQWGNLVGLWHLDEVAGATVADSSTLNNTLDVTGSLATTTGKVGNSFNVNGNYNVYSASSTGNYASKMPIASIGTSVSWTMAFWIYPTQLPKTAFTNQSIAVALQKANSCRPCFYYDSYQAAPMATTSFVFRLNGGTGAQYVGPMTTAKFKANKWQFVVGTYDGTTLKTYYNGLLDTTTVLNQASNWAPEETLIGSWGQGATYGSRFPGSVDEVAIWKSVLTPLEIKNIYDQQSCGKN